MNLSPRLYHWMIRPRWLTQKYIHNYIQNHFRLKNKAILDFGCGTGANCCICCPDQYLGIDPDENRIDLAKRIYPNHSFEAFNEYRIPSDDKRFDYIFIIAVLHHISDKQIKHYLNEFERVLKPQGRLIVIEPYLKQQSKINNLVMKRYDNGEYIRNEKEYLQLFRYSGFDYKVLQKFTKCFFYNEIFFSAQPRSLASSQDYRTIIREPASHQGVNVWETDLGKYRNQQNDEYK